MARHPSDRWRLLRALVLIVRFEPVAALLFALLFLVGGTVLAQLLREAGWLPGWLATLPPIRPGLWR